MKTKKNLRSEKEFEVLTVNEMNGVRGGSYEEEPEYIIIYIGGKRYRIRVK